MTGPVAQSEKIIEMFNREQIDPAGKKILGFALLYERGVAPAVWVGPGPDPFAVAGEDEETRQARFYATKIIPGYQPHFIPGHLTIDQDTAVAGRQFRQGERLDVGYVNQVLATMLANLLLDQDLSNCSALSLSGESHALGKARFAIVVGEATKQKELDIEAEKSQKDMANAEVEMPQDEDLEQIITDINDPDEEVRKVAIKHLGEIGDQRAITSLITAFKDNKLSVIWAASAALVKIGSPALKPLKAALKDNDAEVRRGAARTLGEMGDPQFVEPLIAALKDSDKDVRMAAASALGKIGDDRAVEPLCRALKDKWDVGVCAAEALGNFEDERAVEPLIDAIKHEDWSLWKYAATALGKIGDPRAVPVLRELTRDSNEQISHAAVEALDVIKKKGQATPAQPPPKTERAPIQDAGTAAILNDMKQAIERYHQAIEYLDQCDQFEFENLLEAHRIAGTIQQESGLRMMWDDAKYILPGPNNPGGVESLRPITRESFTSAAAELQNIFDATAAVSVPPPATPRVSVPTKPTPTQEKKSEKKGRSAWFWILGILAVVVLCAVFGNFVNRSASRRAATFDTAAEQPNPEAPITASGLEEVEKAVQPVPSYEEPTPMMVAEEPIQVESEGGLSYLERAMAGEFSGTEVKVLGRVTDQEVVLFNESISDFQDGTGIRVVYDANSEFENILSILIAAGDPPDIVDMPQPSLLTTLVRDGQVVDVSQFLDMNKLRGNYNQAWLDLATMEGPEGPILAGVWHRSTNKSIVWYPKKEFEAAGYEVPSTWDELMRLSQQIADDGGTAWCIGMESGSATGWVATDWVENILIRTTSTTNYDQWVIGQLPFASPEVSRAVEIMSNIWFNEDYVYGGSEAILTTAFDESPDPMFDDPPGCWLHMQGPWITLHFPEGLEPGIDYDFFTLPPIDETYGNPIIVYGNIMTMFNDRPEVRALMEYFSTGESVEAWIKAGAAISPHNDSSLSWYTNDTDRHIAETIIEADTVRFDASDMMPPEVAYGSFWAGMKDYVGGADLDTVLKAIDQSWP